MNCYDTKYFSKPVKKGVFTPRRFPSLRTSVYWQAISSIPCWRFSSKNCLMEGVRYCIFTKGVNRKTGVLSMMRILAGAACLKSIPRALQMARLSRVARMDSLINSDRSTEASKDPALRIPPMTPKNITTDDRFQVSLFKHIVQVLQTRCDLAIPFPDHCDQLRIIEEDTFDLIPGPPTADQP